MDSEILLSQLNDIIECGICTETFCDPRLLPCFHTFCLRCLQQLRGACNNTERMLACPLCRTEFSVSPDGVETMPRNFIVHQLADMKKTCARKAGTREHVHQILNGSEPLAIQSGAKIPAKNRCLKHELEDICLFCIDCNVVLCRLCFDEEHKAHRSANIKETGDMLRKRIQKDIERLSVCLNEVHQRRRELSKTRADFLTEAEKSEEEVNEQFSRLSELIKRHRQSLISELATLKRNRLKEIENEKEELERHLVVLESCERYMQDMRIKHSANDICRSVDELNSKVQELQVLHKAWMDRPPSLNPTHSFEEAGIVDAMSTQNPNIIGQIKVRHPGCLRLDSKLDLGNQLVRGVVRQQRNYYVISWNSDFIEVYRQQNETFLHLRRVKISGLSCAQDMALCRKSGSLYGTDQGTACVWQVTLADHSVKRWLNGIDDPFTISATDSGEVLLLKNGPPPALTVYNLDASLVCSTPLPVTRERALHAVKKSSTGNYVVSQGHFVYEMTPEGIELRRLTLDPSAQLLHLAVGEDDRIFAADYMNGKVVLLDRELRLSEVLLDKTKNDLQWPCRLSFSKRKLLVVHKGIDVYSLLKP